MKDKVLSKAIEKKYKELEKLINEKIEGEVIDLLLSKYKLTSFECLYVLNHLAFGLSEIMLEFEVEEDVNTQRSGVVNDV